MSSAFLGPEYSHETLRRALAERRVAWRELDRDALLDETASEIERGSVVGWFQGRSEWGPRALGNRSILAHPGLPRMKDILNARIKHREPFRPFAPSILAERQSAVFEHDHPSPFMQHVYRIRAPWRERLCAVNHVDDTGRLQSVSREANPLYYDLIRAFEARTGIPVVLNTSFNENEPIVEHPAEAGGLLPAHEDGRAGARFLLLPEGGSVSAAAHTAPPRWRVREVRALRGFAVEWLAADRVLLSRRNVLYEAREVGGAMRRIGVLPQPAWPFHRDPDPPGATGAAADVLQRPAPGRRFDLRHLRPRGGGVPEQKLASAQWAGPTVPGAARGGRGGRQRPRLLRRVPGTTPGAGRCASTATIRTATI